MVPLVMEGVYVEVSEFTFENLLPRALHVALVALPPIVPFNVTVPPGTTVCGFPAFTVATGSTVITTVEVAAVHGPAPSGSFVVNVSVTVPLVIAGVYEEV